MTRFKTNSNVKFFDGGLLRWIDVKVIKKEGNRVLITHPSGQGTLLVDENELLTVREHNVNIQASIALEKDDEIAPIRR